MSLYELLNLFPRWPLVFRSFLLPPLVARDVVTPNCWVRWPSVAHTVAHNYHGKKKKKVTAKVTCWKILISSRPIHHYWVNFVLPWQLWATVGCNCRKKIPMPPRQQLPHHQCNLQSQRDHRQRRHRKEQHRTNWRNIYSNNDIRNINYHSATENTPTAPN